MKDNEIEAVLRLALEALEKMMEEFRGYDLPYGSKAYALAKDARLELFTALRQAVDSTEQHKQAQTEANERSEVEPVQIAGFDVVIDESMPPNKFKFEQAQKANERSEVEPVVFKFIKGELCYKSREDDQSFGMWCPVASDFEGTEFYTSPPQRPMECKPLSDEQRCLMSDKYGSRMHGPDSAAYWYFKGIDDTEAAHGIMSLQDGKGEA